MKEKEKYPKGIILMDEDEDDECDNSKKLDETHKENLGNSKIYEHSESRVPSIPIDDLEESKH